MEFEGLPREMQKEILQYALPESQTISPEFRSLMRADYLNQVCNQEPSRKEMVRHLYSIPAGVILADRGTMRMLTYYSAFLYNRVVIQIPRMSDIREVLIRLHGQTSLNRFSLGENVEVLLNTTDSITEEWQEYGCDLDAVFDIYKNRAICFEMDPQFPIKMLQREFSKRSENGLVWYYFYLLLNAYVINQAGFEYEVGNLTLTNDVESYLRKRINSLQRLILRYYTKKL